MRRVRIRRAGGHERLELEDFEPRRPGPGEVAIDVRSVGVNYADVLVRLGLYESAKKQVGWPITPGFDVAGVVRAVGEGVTDVVAGERVYAVCLFGGYSERVVVPANQVFALPEAWSFAEGGTFCTAFLTAYYAAHVLAAVSPGQIVLVHSAAGGVGLALNQVLRAAGATVVGVVGAPHKVEVARDYGAEHVVDKSSTELWPALEAIAPEGFHAVFDANGVSTLKQSYEHLRPMGRLVVYGFHTMLDKGRAKTSPLRLLWRFLRTPRFDPLDMTGKNKAVLAFNLSYLFEEKALLARAMAELSALVAEGKVRPLPVETFAFDDVAEAHARLESGLSVGKVALLIGDA